MGNNQNANTHAFTASDVYSLHGGVRFPEGKLPEAIFFDWDMTLGRGNMQVFEKSAMLTLAHFGVDPNGIRFKDHYYEERMPFLEDHINSLSAIEQRGYAVPSQEIRDYFYEVDHRITPEEVVVRDGAVELLEWLKNRGVKLGLITNNPQWMANQKASLANVEPYFDVVQGADRTFRQTKPFTEVGELALRKMGGVQPKDAWYIGDHPVKDMGLANTPILVDKQTGERQRFAAFVGMECPQNTRLFEQELKRDDIEVPVMLAPNPRGLLRMLKERFPAQQPEHVAVDAHSAARCVTTQQVGSGV